MARVNCTVTSCVHYGKGDACEAESIMVKSNRGRGYDLEMGTIAGETLAETSAGTCCETFKPRRTSE